MKYLSLIDELNLTTHDINTIDKPKIIRLQKQLKAKAVLEGKINLGVLSDMINHLENPKTREAHLFVERHLWLKYILLNSLEKIDNKSFESTFDPRDISADVLEFTTPFLKEVINPTLSSFLKEKHYFKILRTTEQQRFYSEEIRQKFISFFETKLQLAIAHLKKSDFQKISTQIDFLKHPDYSLAMNVLIEPLVNSITAVNSEVINVYNLGNEWGTKNHTSWDYASQVLISFGKLTPANPELRDVFRKNARIAQTERDQLYNYSGRSTSSTPNFSDNVRNKRKHTSQNHKTEKKNSSLWTVIRVIAILFGIVRIIIAFSGNNSNSYNEPYNNDYTNFTQEEYKKLITETIKNGKAQDISKDDDSSKVNKALDDELDKLEKQNDTINESTYITNSKDLFIPKKVLEGNDNEQDNHIRFFYSLKNKVLIGNKKGNKAPIRPIQSFSNPYPKTFNTIPSEKNLSGGSSIYVKNSLLRKLIIFRLKNGRDQAIIIPVNSQKKLAFNNGDTIVFYAGTHFEKSKFSTFRKQQDISHLYILKDITNSSKITIQSFQDNISEDSNERFLRKEILKTKHIQLNQLNNIDLLYTDYYNKYYRNK